MRIHDHISQKCFISDTVLVPLCPPTADGLPVGYLYAQQHVSPDRKTAAAVLEPENGSATKGALGATDAAPRTAPGAIEPA